MAGPCARSPPPHGKIVRTDVLNQLPPPEAWMPQTYLLLRKHSLQSSNDCHNLVFVSLSAP